MIRKICIISSYYPNKKDPVFSFVGTLVEQIADMGVECHVISPVSYFEVKHRTKSRMEYSPNGNKIYVYCPKYLKIPRKIAYSFSVKNRRTAVWRAYKKYVGDCDCFYSHFLVSGNDAAWMKKKTDKPAFIACGESNLRRNEQVYTMYRENIYNGFDGIIYVSSAIKKDAEMLDIFSENIPAAVFPNGVNTAIFHRYDYRASRKALGVADDAFTVAFVGAYTKRKGFDKLQKILIAHPTWKCILIGFGELRIEVQDSQVVFAGRVEHNKIPQLISAADVFVLPTLAEGCCNAIVEALACGLPVISSALPFNDDILDKSCSMRVDPENTDEIAAAIERLEKDKIYRAALAEGALSKVAELNITTRAQSILRFMDECIENECKID